MSSSKRGYLTPTDLEAMTGLELTESEALKKINAAEALIDAFVGFQEKAICDEYHGEVSGAIEKTIFDTDGRTQLLHYDDYFLGCWLEIIGGSGAGQQRRIVSSSYAGKSITYEGDALNPAPNSSTSFRIFQLGKFPRRQDMTTNRDGNRYYKAIPQAVREATAAQVEFMVDKGDEFFTSDGTDMQSESFGNYAYSRGSKDSAAATYVRMVSPKVRTLLHGIVNRTGRLTVGEP